MKSHKFRGHTVIVWSAGGVEWAKTVVTALGLENYVDLVVAKPKWYYDDLQSHEFLPASSRVYHEDTE
jgi:phosphoserine phosphatase